MPPKAPRWNKKASKEVERQFDLFTQTQGKDGWDPRERAPEYVKNKVKDNFILRPYLAGSSGGYTTHKTCQKVLRGYERVSSEYFVKIAKSGIRRSTLLTVMS